MLGPIIVTAYFIAVWRYYLAPIDSDNPVAFGYVGANWIFYSWFVVGVIGLNLSLYGMEGVEAGMLMEPSWNVGDGMKLMMHADNAWSGPGGWMKTIKWSWQMSRRNGRFILPAALWFVLALPSMFVFTAYPLSGLTMEMTSGYLHGKDNGTGPAVVGFSHSNFNERHLDDVYNGATTNWKNALDARVAGYGAVYTPKGYDRSQQDSLKKLPAVLPKDDGVNRLFLTAQAENPIEGKGWGLLLQYNCSIVNKLEDLRILNNRNNSMDRFQDGSTQIRTRNQTNNELGPEIKWVDNHFGVMETGYQVWPNMTAMDRVTTQNPYARFTNNYNCYFNEAENITGDYPGIEQEGIFEIVLWQLLFPNGFNTTKYDFNVDHNITDLYGSYIWNSWDVFQKAEYESVKATLQEPSSPMTAIGVQCKASSSVGTADIDGVSSSYSNFVRTDTPISVQTYRCAERFGADIPLRLMPAYGKDWLASLFTSAAAPPPFYASYVTSDQDIDTATGRMLQLNYLQAEQLRQSMLGAYAAYAAQLMYNGGQGFTTSEGSQIRFNNPNVTEFVSGTVITRGVVPVEVPVMLFVAWALVASCLGVVYGFRRRWSAMLDGYTMFRLGAALPDDVKRKFTDYSNTLEVDDCVGLHGVPGLVGDTEKDMWVGRIGLVEGSKAQKGKMYE